MRPVGRALALLGGGALVLAGCTSTVTGTAAPGEAAGDGAGEVACDWQPAPGRGGAVLDAEQPPDRVPATGTATLVLATDQGDIGLALDRDGAACAVASLLALAEQGWFDDTPCHRLTEVPGLQVLQCGDPTGTGTGRPSYRYPTQTSGDETYRRGTVAMANAADGFDGSQFFLVWGGSELPPDYTVVGTVDDAGLEVLDTVAAEGSDGANSRGDGAPNLPVTIEEATTG